jgi:hypothetical protein
MIELVGSLLMLGLMVGLAIFEVLMLINAAKTKQWGWFVGILFLSPFIAIAYRFMAYRSPSAIMAERSRVRDRRLRRQRALRNEIAQLKKEVGALKASQQDSAVDEAAPQ